MKQQRARKHKLGGDRVYRTIHNSSTPQTCTGSDPGIK